MKIKKLILLFPILILFNCSLQKRKYQTGYFISWNKNINNLSIAKNKNQKEFNAKKNEIKYSDTSFEKDITASANNKITKIFNSTIKYNLEFPDSCDEIIYNDRNKLKAKITEINSTEILYKKCDFIDGPTFIDKQNKVFMIKYANGKSKVFKRETANEYSSDKIKENTEIYKIDKKTNPITRPPVNLFNVGFKFGLVGSIIGITAWLFGGNYTDKGMNKTEKDSINYNKSNKFSYRIGVIIGRLFLILSIILLIMFISLS